MRSEPKILVVDDDLRNVRLMESILRSGGYPVIKAYDGDEALRVVEAENPDLVLLDVMMPRMSGFEVCRRLRGQHATRLLPVIMVTALNALEEKVQALELGADDFLSKPINKTELLAKMRSVLRVKALHDEVEATRGELEKKNRDLVRLEEFKERLVQMVVHDLKNPLSGIMGNLQLLEMQVPPAEGSQFREILGRTKESSRQLLGMILNLLDIARLEERRLIPRQSLIRPEEMVRARLREIEGFAARSGITISTSFEDSLPELRADPDLIGRILGNLLNNALKHTPEGGRVEAGVSTVPGGIRFRITDSGDGIPEELLPRIFDRFVVGPEGGNPSPKGHNTGLGLTFSKLAVEAHGGTLEVASRVGKGSSFSFVLPIEGNKAASAEFDQRDLAGGE